MNYRIYLWAVSVVALSFGACTSTPHPDGKPLPRLTFNHLQPLPLNVEHIDVVEPPQNPAGDFLINPSAAVKNYFSRRFEARGSRDLLRVVINDSKVVSAEKDAEGRITHYLGVAGQNVYNVTVWLTLEHVSASGQILYSRSLKATRTMNITEHASVAEREQHQFAGMETMFAELDAAIIKIVLDEMKLGSPAF